ncbi:SRPBCC family protein [Azospirillum rugosum]|uniref:Carbon monoxide dehydrogenase subunit G n=1 Tax=Azospirillum rugosum TaxID=416170 RepID=A0ABS4SEJ1_9PROT|nr:carbon monoxide dehydrogenase subunit G [Azospirillum rugosum]MBP2290483.1 carbon monoxide dehydrogenase subunit G [Azospirillum rugosum]MDQ0525371.1 carbon monoxide dehydrogenase subunit G [Azospirillum rugosum]
MDMSGSQRIAAPREAVWKALNDPEILRQCIPGCEEVQKVSDTEFTAKVVAKVGPVSAKFAGKVTLSDLDPPNGYTITGEGSGGAAGFGKGGATVTLAPDGDATLLSYTAKAQVGGKLAQIGSRLVDATARKMADDFFTRFTAVVGAPEPAPETLAEPVPAAEPVAAEPEAAPRRVVVAEAPAAESSGASAAPAATVTPAVERPPELPLPLPAARGRGGLYVPWLAILAVAVLVIVLAWMK